MVAIYEYDGLDGREKRHIDEQSPSDQNGGDVYGASVMIKVRDTSNVRSVRTEVISAGVEVA